MFRHRPIVKRGLLSAERKDVAPERADGGHERAELLFVAGYKDIEAVAMTFDIHYVVKNHRFAVDMRGALVRAIDYGCRGTERMYQCV